MHGKIFIEDIEIQGIIGCHPGERTRKRSLFVDIEVALDLSLACRSDNLEDTLNYEKVVSLCQKAFDDHSPLLLEKLAFEILQLLFVEFPLFSARVRVKKPAALAQARSCNVELFQEKNP